MFGLLLRVATSLAGLVVNYIYVPIDKNLGLLIGRYLAAFGWCVKGQLRGEDDTLVLQTLLPPEEVEWVKAQSILDSPSAIIFRIRSIIANLTIRGKLQGSVSKLMEEKLGDLERAIGACKRIKASPIPPTFTRMTSRVLCLFLVFLPLALVNSQGMQSTVGILVIVTFLSYIFVGLDEISVEVENPFPLLPMFSLSSDLDMKVVMQFAMKNDMPRAM
mmetsp:Transcript_23262/g.43182  ORF Transcript_23262/g.43182 Transcript_23262/m.43182 type:complete len:218 (+) Transcript_23262:429-1082(+)